MVDYVSGQPEKVWGLGLVKTADDIAGVYLDQAPRSVQKYVGFWVSVDLLVKSLGGNEWHSKSWTDGTGPKSTFSCNAPGNAGGKFLWTRRIPCLQLPVHVHVLKVSDKLWAYSHDVVS